MITAPSRRQDRRRRIDAKAQAEPSWRCWGRYVHLGKLETRRAASELAKAPEGAPGIDGVSFEAIEGSGVDVFRQQRREERVARTQRPRRNRRQAMPQEGRTKGRGLSIPASRARVGRGAVKRSLEPIVEADVPPGSQGDRPKRRTHDAGPRVAEGIVPHQTRVLDIDRRAFFDHGRPHGLVSQGATRVDDAAVMPGRTMMLQAAGKPGVPPGGVRSPGRRHLSRPAVDRRLARATAVTRRGQSTDREDARVAEALVLLVAAYPPQAWLLKAVDKRRREELATLQVERKEEKSRRVDLAKGERFGCLGVDVRRGRRLQGKWRPHETPKLKQRTALLRQRKAIVRRVQSHPVDRVVQRMNPILRGWVNSCAIGASSRGFSDVRDGVEKQVRRHRRRARNLRGLGQKRWRRRRRYDGLGRCTGSRVRRLSPAPTALPAREVSSPWA